MVKNLWTYSFTHLLPSTIIHIRFRAPPPPPDTGTCKYSDRASKDTFQCNKSPRDANCSLRERKLTQKWASKIKNLPPHLVPAF